LRPSDTAGTDEDRAFAQLRALRRDLIDPTIAVHNGRVVKRDGDGSVVDTKWSKRATAICLATASTSADHETRR
jgi:class 3 adenylate cyclase